MFASPVPARNTTLSMIAVIGYLLVIGYLVVIAPASAVSAAEFEGFTEPFRTVRLSVTEGGRITDLPVQRGDRVSPQDLLLELDTSVLAASRQVLTAKLASRAALSALEVEQEMLQQRADQLQALQAKGAGTPDEARRAAAEAEVARLNVLAAQEEQAIRQQELAELDARIEQRRIRAPIGGMITERLYEPGEFVSPMNPHVMTLVDLTELRATFYIPTQLALSLAVGNTAGVQLVESADTAPARIAFVAAVTAADSGLVRVDLLIDNHLGKYRSGVRCRWTPTHSSQLGAEASTLAPTVVPQSTSGSGTVARPESP